VATHLVAWQQSVDQAALAAINTVVDDVLTRSGATRYFVPAGYNFVRWALATGPSLTRARIFTPSLGTKRIDLEVEPKRTAANTLTLTGLEVMLPRRPYELVPGEEVEFQTAEGGAMATQMNGVVALSPAELPPMPDGDIRAIRAAGTTTLTAFAWTTVTVTPDTSLEAGTYQLVGMLPISAGAIAARAIITGEVFRPGAPGLAGTDAAASDFDRATMDDTIWYAMGEFTHQTIPQIQFFSATADTSETVYLYAVRTGAAPTGAPG